MAAMTKKQRVRATLAGEAVDRPAVSMWGHDYVREWSMQELVGATLEPYRAHDWDFIKFHPRWTLFGEAWGNVYEPPGEQRNPKTVSVVVSSATDLAVIEPVDARGGVFGEHLGALRTVLDAVGDEVDVVQTIFSPLSVLGLLCGRPDTLLRLAEEDAASVHAAIAAVTETLIGYTQASLEAGAAGVFYAPLVWASHDTCDEDFYREFGRPYDLQLLAHIRDADFNILHVCRNHNMIDLLLDYPVGAFNWDDQGEGNPSLADVHARTDKAVMGGIDRSRIAEVGAAEVAKAASAARDTGASRVFVTPGCSVPLSTPEANRAALAAAVR